MTVSLDIRDPRHDAEPPDWEDLRRSAGQVATWRYEVLRTNAWARRSPSLLTILRDSGKPVAVVNASLERPTFRFGTYAPPHARPSMGILDIRLPGTAHQGWWFAGDPTIEERRELLRSYLKGIRKELGKWWLAAQWREVTPEDRTLIPGSPRLFRTASPNTRLTTSWPTLEAWSATLRKDRRGTLRRHARQMYRDPNLSIGLDHAKDLVDAAEVSQLWTLNLAKYHTGLMPYLPYSLPYIDALISSPEIKAITYRGQNSQLLAISLIIDHPTWPIFYMWGSLPPEQGGRPNIYFDNYMRLVDWTIKTKKAGMIWGRGQIEPKLDLGAELVPLQTAIVAQ